MSKKEKKEKKKLSKKGKIIVISTVSTLLVAFCILLVIAIFTPKLELSSSAELNNVVGTYKLELNVGDEIPEINYKASKFGNDLSSKVEVNGVIDNNHVGTYIIYYKVKDGLFEKEKKLEVSVVDKTAPELNLEGEAEVKVCSLEKFEEPGYSAIDNYDGDITERVEKVTNDSLIDYKVKDSSGNETKKERKLIVTDEEGPVITLNGNETTYVTKGATYTEKGATASDNCDGDLSEKIETSGSVDTSKLGTYEIKYSVKDSKDNVSEKLRKVIVSEPRAVSDKNDSNQSGVIYLTFDDGPGAYTGSILDTLNKYGVKATFFVTRSGSDDIIRRQYNEGHTVALHTYTHDYDIYKSVATYLDDLNKIATRVKNITGQDAKYVRFPGGSSNQKIYFRSNNTITIYDLINELNNRGYKYFDWNVSVEDAGGCVNQADKVSCVVNNFKKYVNPNRANVVLMHDIKSYTAQGLSQMIEYGLSKGFTFKAIDDNTPTCHFR